MIRPGPGPDKAWVTLGRASHLVNFLKEPLALLQGPHWFWIELGDYPVEEAVQIKDRLCRYLRETS